MANYTKSFNFRNGVQVDDNNFIINPSGLVGIGTTKPEKLLDVYGNARIAGISSLSLVSISGVATVGSGITIDAASGIITAVKFVGDGSGLTNTVAITTDGFVAQAGSIGTTAKVGVGTESPRSQFDVVGNVRVEGISTFTGNGNYSAGLAIDVVGHTELDNLNVSGLSTFGGNLDINADIDVDGHTELDDLNVTGVSTFAEVTINTGITPDTDEGAYLGTAALPWSEAHIDEIRIGVSGDGEIDTATGNLTLDSAGGTTDIDDNLSVTGVSTFTGAIDADGDLDVDGHTELDDLNVSGIATIGVASITTLNPVKALVATGIATFKDDVEFHGVAGVTSAFWDKDNNRLELKDNVMLTFGETRDLQISHDGADSIIKDAGVGRLKILGGFQVKNVGDTQTLITANTSGASATNVELYHENTLKFETVSVGASTYGQLNVARLNGGTSNLSQSYGALRYGNEIAAFDYSTRKSLDLLNYDTGNINFNLDAANKNTNLGDFHWSKYNNPIMTLTNDGNLGIGLTEPEYKLHVSGVSTFTANVTAGANLTVNNNLNVGNDLTVTGALNSDVTGNVTGYLFGDVVSPFAGISTFNHSMSSKSIGIGTTGTAGYPFRMKYDDGEPTSSYISIDENGLLHGLTKLSVGTQSSSNAGINFADAGGPYGGGSAHRFMIPPTVNNSARAGLSTAGAAGAVIYNSSINKLQVYTGDATGWETITSS